NRLHGAFVRSLRKAGLHRDHPIVQRAGDAAIVNDALAERAAPVRTFILQGKNAIVGSAEDGDGGRAMPHATRAAPGNVIDCADRIPTFRHHVHRTASRDSVAMGLNSCLSLPEARSDHGSTWANFCEKTKRSK